MSSIELPTVASVSSDESVSSWRDMLGIIASIACAVHCAAMPFVIAYLPALGISFLADSSFHKWMALICFLVAFAAFVPGLWRHRNFWPVGIASVGLSLITYAAFALPDDCCSPNKKLAGKNMSGALVATDSCEHCDHCTPSTNSQCTDSQCTDSQCTDSQCTDSQCTDSQCTDSQCTDSQCTDSQCTDSQCTDSQCTDSQCTDSQCSEQQCCGDEERGTTVLATTQQSQTGASKKAETTVIANDEGSWLALIMPWITPVGGLVLVVAHLMNHRLSCDCNCCGIPKHDEESICDTAADSSC